MNLEKISMPDCRRLFNFRRGQTYVPNHGIRGGEKKYEDMIDALKIYFDLSAAEQKEANEVYKNNTSIVNKRRHRSHFQFLNSKRSKLMAINNNPNGLQIANEIGFDTTGIEDIVDGEEEDDEEIEPHIGLASTDEDLARFESNRTDDRRCFNRGKNKPSMSDVSTETRHRSRVIHSKSFYSAAAAVARSNDATFLDPEGFPAALIRTNVMITANECKELSEAGGNLRNNNRRSK